MFAVVVLVIVAAIMLRAGIGLFALVFKLAFGLLGLFLGGVLAICAVGLALLISGAAGIGVLLLVAMVLAPLWVPLLLAGCLIWALFRSGRTLAAV